MTVQIISGKTFLTKTLGKKFKQERTKRKKTSQNPKKGKCLDETKDHNNIIDLNPQTPKFINLQENPSLNSPKSMSSVKSEDGEKKQKPKMKNLQDLFANS